MAPTNTSKKPRVKKVARKERDFGSPQQKAVVTKNKKLHFKHGFNMMKAVNLEALEKKGQELTAEETAFVQEKLYSDTPAMYGDKAAMELQFQQHRESGETGLTAEEWETLQDIQVLNSVVFTNPLPIVAEILGHSTLHDRVVFYRWVHARDTKLRFIKKEPKTNAAV